MMSVPSSYFIFHSTHRRACVMCAQSCLTLCNPMDCSLPGSAAHGIFQARILEIAISFSRGSSPQGLNPCLCVSCIAGGFFISWVISKAQQSLSGGWNCQKFLKDESTFEKIKKIRNSWSLLKFPSFIWTELLGSPIGYVVEETRIIMNLFKWF